MNNLTLQSVENEARVLDIDLARALGFKYEPHIRPLISRLAQELATHGLLSHVAIKSHCSQTEGPASKRGRPGKAYYLNEAQALLVCMFSRTEKAAEVRKQVIEVFQAWRHGNAAPPAIERVRQPLDYIPIRAYTLPDSEFMHIEFMAPLPWRTAHAVLAAIQSAREGIHPTR